MVASGAAAAAHAGLGKVGDGEYGPGGALLRAWVEWAAAPRWVLAGELERVLPAEEALLCERALARGLVPAHRESGLRERLERFRAGKLEFVRTPGLLDGLWAVLQEPLGAPGLAELFELGAEERAVALAAERAARAATATPPIADLRARAACAPSGVELVCDPLPRVRPTPPRPGPSPLRRPASATALLTRVLETLNHGALREVARACGLAGVGVLERAKALRLRILAGQPPVLRILDALSAPQLVRACVACGVEPPPGNTAQTIALARARLLLLMAPPDAPLARPGEERAWTAALLGRLELRVLLRLERELDLNLDSHRADGFAERLAARFRTVDELLDALDGELLRELARAWALPEQESPIALRWALRETARGAGSFQPQTAPERVRRPEAASGPDWVRARVLGSLDHVTLLALADKHGLRLASGTPTERLRAACAGIPVRRLLLELPGEPLARAAAACGVDGVWGEEAREALAQLLDRD